MPPPRDQGTIEPRHGERAERGYRCRPGAELDVGTGNAKLSRVGMRKANARTFACEACGALVDWMSAFARAAARESTNIAPGDACTSRACCITGNRRYRAPTHIERQMERLEGLVSGSHTLVHRPLDTINMTVNVAGGRRAVRIVRSACRTLRSLTVEMEGKSDPPVE